MPFVKGQSGNPSGRPKEDPEIKALARQHGPAAIARLAALLECGNPRTEVAAAQALLDRGYGKAVQPIAGSDDHPPLAFLKFERVLIRANAESADT